MPKAKKPAFDLNRRRDEWDRGFASASRSIPPRRNKPAPHSAAPERPRPFTPETPESASGAGSPHDGETTQPAAPQSRASAKPAGTAAPAFEPQVAGAAWGRLRALETSAARSEPLAKAAEPQLETPKERPASDRSPQSGAKFDRVEPRLDSPRSDPGKPQASIEEARREGPAIIETRGLRIHLTSLERAAVTAVIRPIRPQSAAPEKPKPVAEERQDDPVAKRPQRQEQEPRLSSPEKTEPSRPEPRLTREPAARQEPHLDNAPKLDATPRLELGRLRPQKRALGVAALAAAERRLAEEKADSEPRQRETLEETPAAEAPVPLPVTPPDTPQLAVRPRRQEPLQTAIQEEEEEDGSAVLSVPPRPLRGLWQAPQARPLLSGVALLGLAGAVALAFTLWPGSSAERKESLVTELQQRPEVSRAASGESSAAPVTGSSEEASAPPEPPQAAPQPPEENLRPAEDPEELPQPRPQDTDGTAPATADESTGSGGVPTPEEIAALATDSGATHAQSGEAPAASNNLVASVQRALLWRGFDPGPVDGMPGAKTKAAVRAFQRKIGADATGVIDIALLRQLESVKTAPPASSSAEPGDGQGSVPPGTELVESQVASTDNAAALPDSATDPVQPQERSPAASSTSTPLVGEVQRALQQRGYDPGPADGVEGPQTQAAVRAYQRDSGLAVDGKVDRSLLTRLEDSTAARAGRETAGTGGVSERLDGVVEAVAGLFGLKRGGEVDPGFKRGQNANSSR